MSKMSEIDMMVQQAVEMVEEDGTYLVAAMQAVKAEWALDIEEFDMVYREANYRVYG
jgi:hypothetical protein